MYTSPFILRPCVYYLFDCGSLVGSLVGWSVDWLSFFFFFGCSRAICRSFFFQAWCFGCLFVGIFLFGLLFGCARFPVRFASAYAWLSLPVLICVLSASFIFLLTPAGGDAVDHGLPPGQAPEEVLQEQAPRLALFFITCCQGCHPSCWLL